MRESTSRSPASLARFPPVSTHPDPAAATRHLAWGALACTAIASPTLIAYNVAPSATLLNQAASLIGWGAFLTLLIGMLPPQRTASRNDAQRSGAAGIVHLDSSPRNAPLAALIGAFSIVLLASLASPFWASLPWSLSLSSAGTILAAMLAVLAGAALQRTGCGVAAFRAFCVGMVVASIGGSLIGLIQVYVPQLADGDWIARSGMPGRAVGNLRQPNHLSSLLLWGVIAAVWLGEAQVVKRWLAWAASLLFIFVVVLTGSRTGAIGTVLLAGWGVLDRRLSPSMRRLLWIAPLAYAAIWWGNSAWADYSHHVFGGEKRFSGAGDISSSRFGIWSNTLALIRMHPWLGVGFGEFNFAWTLTPFPHRPVAFFDHTHNLILQFVVELGVPLALLVLALFGGAFFGALGRARHAGDDLDPAQAPMLRAAFMMVFMIVVHSMLEYPLWYAYFLLPTAFALGLGLGLPPATSTDPRSLSVTSPIDPPRPALPVGASARSPLLLLASLLLLCFGFFTLYDYLRVVVIFAPPDDAGPLVQRIDDGRHSWFFSHHADYAAATTELEPRPAAPMRPFVHAPHYLLDARLMMSWAKALNDAGEVDKARYVAARLKEFRNEQAEDFFAVCGEPPAPGKALPFQCQAPMQEYRYEDFR